MIQANIVPYPSPWIVGMSPSTFYVRLRDDKTGQAVNLTGGTVTGKLGSNVMSGAFTIADAPTGSFFYAPNGTEATGLTANRYLMQFQVAGAPSGTVISELFPIDVQAAL